MLVKQTLRDVIFFSNHIAGLHMSLLEGKKFCGTAWIEPYNYIQLNKIEPIETKYSITKG